GGDLLLWWLSSLRPPPGRPASSLSRGVFVSPSAFFWSCVDTLSCSLSDSTELDCAMWLNTSDSDASMIAPANASPNESPKDPPAELTPAASLTRSSSIGQSVQVLSWETSRPPPQPP